MRLRWRPPVAAIIALVAVLAVGYLQLSDDDGKVDATTLGLLVLAVALIFAVCAPSATAAFLQRISNFKVGGLEVGLSEIKRAERVRPLPGEDDGVNVADRPLSGNGQRDFQGIAKELREKLQFVWDILELGGDEIPKADHARIASRLRADELLTADEEQLVRDLLAGDGSELADWSTTTQREFLDAAWQFTARFGPMIWDRHVRRQLGIKGWLIADFEQAPGHRPDFLAHHESVGWVLMTARVAGTTDKPSKRRGRAAKRLAKFKRSSILAGRRIVIPRIRVAAPVPEPIRILTLTDLEANPSLAAD